MAPPETIPARAPHNVVLFQNKENSTTGPNAAPKPAHAKLTISNTELSGFLAINMAKKENKNLLQYLIILLFIFTCTPSILTVFNINLKYPTLFTGFTLYFILGYYLNTFEINKKYRYVVYILGLISLIITPILTINYSILNNIHSQRFFEYGSFNIYLYSASLFLLFKNIFNKKEETKLLNSLSKLYFGIYLIHGLVLGLLMKYNVFNLNMNLTIKVFFVSLIVFIISLITSFILSKIPFIKRLIYVK